MNYKKILLLAGEPDLPLGAFEHVGDRRIKPRGGGGGGSYYANLDKLYAAQTQQAQQLMQQSANVVYPAYDELVDQAKNTGSRANQEAAAGQSAADTAAAYGAAKQNATENLASLGVNPADSKYANTMADIDLQGAASSATGQTQARQKQRDLGFAQMQDVVNSGLGISSNATSALNSAGTTASNMASLQNSANASNAAAAGSIATLASRAFFKDGGQVRRGMACGGIVARRKYANGGIVNRGFGITPPAPPASAPANASMNNQVAGAAGVGMVGKGAAASAGSKLQALGNATGSESLSSFGAGLKGGQAAADAAQASVGAQSAASGGAAAGAALDTGATAEAATAAGDAAAATTAATAAEGASMAGLGATVGAAMPYVGAALLVGSAMGWFADGGQVRRGMNPKRTGGIKPGSNDRAGGPVSGPGGPKDDQVPAMLSPGEFVMPVGAVKLYGTKKLEQMRHRGLSYEKKIGITG